MGVMNVTPNSFSDGGEFFSPEAISQRIQFLDQFEAIDIGAESTAPSTKPITWKEEWERWKMVLPYLKNVTSTVSVDSYHPETIFELLKYWKDHKLKSKFIWNDISGKYDESVLDYLKTGHDYIYCHNLSPTREQAGQHMKYLSKDVDLYNFFHLRCNPQVIFDPALGFSKTYEQNWEIIKNFAQIQRAVQHDRWLIGFSRKSFLRQKYNASEIAKLDELHMSVLQPLLAELTGELWVRTHRPELL